jgi:roadblock/LC7 domain-containing protein
MLHEAIYALNPSIKVIRGDVAYDDTGNVVEYDKAAVETKAAELEAEAQAAVEAQAAAKQSALNKLMALGLTEEEALALGVK